MSQMSQNIWSCLKMSEFLSESISCNNIFRLDMSNRIKCRPTWQRCMSDQICTSKFVRNFEQKPVSKSRFHQMILKSQKPRRTVARSVFANFRNVLRKISWIAIDEIFFSDEDVFHEDFVETVGDGKRHSDGHALGQILILSYFRAKWKFFIFQKKN